MKAQRSSWNDKISSIDIKNPKDAWNINSIKNRTYNSRTSSPFVLPNDIIVADPKRKAQLLQEVFCKHQANVSATTRTTNKKDEETYQKCLQEH